MNEFSLFTIPAQLLYLYIAITFFREGFDHFKRTEIKLAFHRYDIAFFIIILLGIYPALILMNISYLNERLNFPLFILIGIVLPIAIIIVNVVYFRKYLNIRRVEFDTYKLIENRINKYNSHSTEIWIVIAVTQLFVDYKQNDELLYTILDILSVYIAAFILYFVIRLTRKQSENNVNVDEEAQNKALRNFIFYPVVFYFIELFFLKMLLYMLWLMMLSAILICVSLIIWGYTVVLTDSD